MTVLLIACGTSTLKSLLPQGAYAPHVYPRLRKRLSRCTLDCGFKTPESPALRGFVGGPRALATVALYLVLKSNGLRHPKNLPVKFDFSPIDTSANIAKKLPLQLRPKPLFIAFFNFSPKRPTFAFAGESGLYIRLSEKNRTQRLTRRNMELHACRHEVFCFSLTVGQRKAGGSGCTPVTCVRFLRCCGSAEPRVFSAASYCTLDFALLLS